MSLFRAANAWVSLLLLAFLVIGCAAAQPAVDPEPTPETAPEPVPPPSAELGPKATPGFIQYPSLSPDGSLVVFSWAGDLWAVSSAGGVAQQLTTHPANDWRSSFSPDGTTIAFESNRDGAQNLYTMPISQVDGRTVGGAVERVTISDLRQSLGGWSSSGDALLFSAYAEPAIFRHARPYRAPIDGGPVVRITDAFGTLPRAAGDDYLFTRGSWGVLNRPVYRGPGTLDIWRFNADGSFDRLTETDWADGAAYGLPDGSIVFFSSRDGQNNLWKMDADGGNATQLTAFAPTDEEITIGHGVSDPTVSADGSAAAFVVWDRPYVMPIDGEAQPIDIVVNADSITLDTKREDLSKKVGEAALSPDGKTMAVVSRGEIFVRSTEDGRPTRRVTNSVGRDRDLVWSPDGRYLLFTSNRSGKDEIYRAEVTLARSDFEPEEEEADDEADEEPAEEDAEEEADDEPEVEADDGVTGVWSLTATGGDPAIIPPSGLPVTLTMKLDGESVSGSISIPMMMIESSINGAFDKASGTVTFDIEANGATVTISLELAGDTATGSAEAAGVGYDIVGDRVSSSVPGDDSDEDAAGDDEAAEDEEEEEPEIDYGKRWAGSLRFSVEPYITDELPVFRPLPSPDGTRLIYLRERGDAVVFDVVSGESRDLFAHWEDAEIIWAGDSRHIVYAKTDLDFNTDIWLLDTTVADAEPVNLTQHPDSDTSPRLSADGKVLYFRSDRHGDNWDYGVYRVFLDKDIEGMLGYERDEYFADAVKAAKKRKPPKPLKDETEEQELADDTDEDDEGEEADTGDEAAEEDAEEKKENGKKKDEPFEFDTDDAYKRVRRIAAMPASQGSLMCTPGGDRVLFSASVDGSSALWSVDWKGEDRKKVQPGGVGDLRMRLTGDKITFVKSGQAMTSPPSGGKAETFGIDAEITIEIADEQFQKFTEAGQVLGFNFYHPTLKGLDWDGLVDRYRSLATQTRTSDEFNRVGNKLFGELNGSHLGMGGGGGFSAKSPGVGSLGVEVEPADDGYRVTNVIKDGPASHEQTRINVGDVLLEVNDTALVGDDGLIDMGRAFVGTAGDEVLLRLRRAEAEEPEYMLITTISQGAENSLRYAAEVERRRAIVDEASDGRLGYVHIQGMGTASVRQFERDLYAAAHGRDGLVIDVRDNGGGWTTDILLSSLTAPAHAFTVPRGADYDTTPRDAYPRDRRLIYGYSKPINVLINANSFSNAEIFAHAIKTIGRGTLVGQQTFGGVISTGGAGLIDGTYIRVPFRGWYLPDGTDMESNGAMPDVDVPITPADEALGRDPQLEAAVAELLDRVE